MKILLLVSMCILIYVTPILLIAYHTYKSCEWCETIGHVLDKMDSIVFFPIMNWIALVLIIWDYTVDTVEILWTKLGLQDNWNSFRNIKIRNKDEKTRCNKTK